MSASCKSCVLSSTGLCVGLSDLATGVKIGESGSISGMGKRFCSTLKH